MSDKDKICETCAHYIKNNDKYECNYTMSIYLTCLNNRYYYEKKNVTESILPSDTK